MLYHDSDRKSLAEFDPITNKIAEIANLRFAVYVSFNTNHTDNPMAKPIIYLPPEASWRGT